ncbi:unnamed protein product, partial [Iphiclides podalirius]
MDHKLLPLLPKQCTSCVPSLLLWLTRNIISALPVPVRLKNSTEGSGGFRERPRVMAPQNVKRKSSMFKS